MRDEGETPDAQEGLEPVWGEGGGTGVALNSPCSDPAGGRPRRKGIAVRFGQRLDGHNWPEMRDPLAAQRQSFSFVLASPLVEKGTFRLWTNSTRS